jgi:hypothetical protein
VSSSLYLFRNVFPSTTIKADEGNASKVHMEDNGSLLGYGGQEKDNQAGYTSGLCEASEVILETHMTTDMGSQNNVAESSPAMEEPTDGYSKYNSLTLAEIIFST